MRARKLERSNRSRSPIDRRLALLAVLCLLTMPQNYRGGAEDAHPHAIFQFWFTGGHVTAEHHHGGGHHDDDTPVPSKTTGSSRLVDNPVVPTISEATPGAERADAIGGIVNAWIVPLLFAALAIVVRSRPLTGLTIAPELPPPRGTTVSSFGY
jgi:hypothetical protein